MILGRVDIHHHRVDNGIGILQQLRRVAADRLEAADRLTDTEQVLVAFRNPCLKVVRVARHGGGKFGHAFEDLAQPGNATAADVYFAEKNVGKHARHRQ